MKMKCLACGAEKDTALKELYPYPDNAIATDVRLDDKARANSVARSTRNLGDYDCFYRRPRRCACKRKSFLLGLMALKNKENSFRSEVRPNGSADDGK